MSLEASLRIQDSVPCDIIVMDEARKEECVEQVASACNVNAETARSYLELFDWNMEVAIQNLLYQSEDEDFVVTDEMVSGSNFAAVEVPLPAISSSVPSKTTSGPKIATMSTIKDSKAATGSDGKEGQAFYVGGAEEGGGGQQVLGPLKLDNSESFVQGIFKAARERGAETLDRTRVIDDAAGPSNRREAFVGTGYRLGTSNTDPVVRVPGKPSSSRGVGVSFGAPFDNYEEDEQANEHSVVVKMWSNGFSLDDGPLRLYTDPASMEFMAAIKLGRIPPELIRSHRREVHVLLEDHHNEPYEPPKAPKVKAFSGVGRALGNPTPKVVTDDASKPAAVSPSDLPPCPQVNQAEPVTELQVRMPDGSRLFVRLNHTHTIQDLRSAIIHQRPDLVCEVFGLHTTFPRKELTDDMASLSSANLLNSTVLVTRK